MQIIRNIKNYERNSVYKVVTIGNFDGLHKGHISIVSKLIEEAKANNGDSILITFDPHPAEVLVNNFHIDLIQTESQFSSILEEAELSALVIEKFTNEYSKLSAEQFFNRIYNHLKFDKLLIGYDFRFGKDKVGNFDFLHAKSLEFGFELEKIEPYSLNSNIISSSKIRNCLSDGEIIIANEFLGRKYSVTGKVVKGAGRGSQIGFPTLNLVCDNKLFLKQGVYETNVIIDNKSYKSITNFGRAPTLKNESEPILEVHILNENLDCYDKKVEVEFCKFIRAEIKFSSVEGLVEQINKDINTVTTDSVK